MLNANTMITEIKHYSQLTLDEFHDMIALRIAVFVIEQNCPYQDLDGLDKDAYHLLVKMDGQLVATARLLKPGVVYPETAIGRVVTSPAYRDRKLGHLLMKTALDFIVNRMHHTTARLSAQSHLSSYYAKHGFQETGKHYLEDGIPHSEMINNCINNQL